MFVGGLGSALLLTALGVFVYALVTHSLDRQFRLLLESRLTVVAAALDTDDHGHIRFDAPSEPAGGRHQSAFPRYIEVWNSAGRVQYKSRELGADSLTFRFPGAKHVYFDDVRVHDDLHVGEMLAAVRMEPDENDHQDGQHGQAGQLGAAKFRRIGLSGDGPKSTVGGKPATIYIIAVAHSLENLDDTKAILAVSLIVGCGGAAWLSVGALILIVSRGLKPVRWISDQIEAVGVADLSDRLATDAVPRELMPIVHRLNDLLCRLQDAFVREKQLTADIAHELRTPVAGLRTTLELADKKLRTTTEYQESVRNCLAVTLHMQAIVENLLILSRLEGNQYKFSGETFRVDLMLAETIEEYAAEISRRNLKLTWNNRSERQLSAPAGAVRLVIRNLLDNAASYTEPEGCVEIALTEDSGNIRLCIANTGSRVAAENAQRVFDRFWRGDEARSLNGLHVGLGLAIVRRIMQAIGGDITVETQAGEWFRVKVLFKNMALNDAS